MAQRRVELLTRTSMEIGCIFVCLGEQVDQVAPEGDQAGQVPHQWHGRAGDHFKA